jgi:hypothetical protein
MDGGITSERDLSLQGKFLVSFPKNKRGTGAGTYEEEHCRNKFNFCKLTVPLTLIWRSKRPVGYFFFLAVMRTCERRERMRDRNETFF